MMYILKTMQKSCKIFPQVFLKWEKVRNEKRQLILYIGTKFNQLSEMYRKYLTHENKLQTVN